MNTNSSIPRYTFNVELEEDIGNGIETVFGIVYNECPNWVCPTVATHHDGEKERKLSATKNLFQFQ